MSRLEIDHLIIAASTLEEGADFLFQEIGVHAQTGGKHETMGTHNLVLRLGGSCYLEILVIDPEAKRPTRPRWFELDSEAIQARLRTGPKLITWAARTDQIEKAVKRAAVPLGTVSSMIRGDLRWKLTLAADGGMNESGVVPFLIEWETNPHPALSMMESGCSLVALKATHAEPDRLRSILASIGGDHLLSLSRSAAGTPPILSATIATPNGTKSIGLND